MNADLHSLYQDVIVDHSRRPRNFGRLEPADRRAAGYNPLCGDRIELHLRLDGEVIAELRFEGAGCAISTASASLMTEALKGKTLAEAERIAEAFRRLATGKASDVQSLGKLAALAGVQEFPARIKCATLAWHTLLAALHDGAAQTVSTEEDER